MQYTIQNETMKIVVSSTGAELISAVANGTERIWQNPTGEWAGHAPLLFPYAGRIAVAVNGQKYPVQMHGVARRAEFSLSSQTENSLTFTLYSSAETKKIFPYDFIFSVTYSIKGNALTVDYAVENPSEETLYFAGGCHEAYALESDVDGYEIEFEKEEDLTLWLHNDDAKLTGETRSLGKMKTMPLDKEGLSNSYTYIFKDILSRSVTLKQKGGKSLVKVTFPEYPHLMFWHAHGAHYICIEPWLNLPDFDGKEWVEFSQKQGVRALAPHAKTVISHTIEYL